MNVNFKRSLSLAMVIALILCMSMTVPTANAASTPNTNVSYSPVTCNASNGSLPAGISDAYLGDTIYFNFQVDSSQKVKSLALSLGDPNGQWHTCYTATAKNYLRYEDFPYKVQLSDDVVDACDLLYYFEVEYTNGKIQDTPVGTIRLHRIRYNTSSSPVESNASNGKMPAEIRSIGVKKWFYFNVQVDSSQKIKSVELYTRYGSGEKWTKVDTDTAKNYMRYTWFKYKATKKGELQYKLNVKYVGANSFVPYTGVITVT